MIYQTSDTFYEPSEEFLSEFILRDNGEQT